MWHHARHAITSSACRVWCSLPRSNLTNKADLAMQLVGCPPHLSEAQLLLQMYATYGLDMLPRLHGKFAFCLYDSKQASLSHCLRPCLVVISSQTGNSGQWPVAVHS